MVRFGYKDLLMLLLAAMPILNIYMSPLPGFAIGYFLVLIFVLLYSSNIKGKKLFYWDKGYIIFWIYVAITFMFSCMASGYLYRGIIPGGVSFFVFSLMFGFFFNKTDLSLLHKYIKIVAYVAISIFVLQEVSLRVLGRPFSALIPFLTLTDGTPVSELIYIQLVSDRSSSLFREPAHFAQFLIVALALDMFIEEKGRKLSYFSIICILALLFSRSGNGLVGLMVLATMKALAIMRGRRTIYKYVIIILIPLSLAWALPYYMESDAGQNVMLRTEELSFDESSRSYMRLYRGYALFEALPTVNKIFGTDSEGMLSATHNSGVSGLFLGERNSDLYCNGLQQLLLNTGIVGLTIFMLFTIPYFRRSSFLGKAALLALLALSLVSGMYLSPIMLLMYLIAIEDAKRNSRDIVFRKEKVKQK